MLRGYPQITFVILPPSLNSLQKGKYTPNKTNSEAAAICRYSTK